MKRFIQSVLVEWKNSSHRRPLLLRGARQVGKTYLVREFAKAHYKNLIEVNFELQPEFKKIFETPDATQIIQNLNLLFGANHISPHHSLIFLDEIQQCPKAITAFRYFYENQPDYHIMGAGSLLEFVFKSEELSVPVGRLDYLFMHPLTFEEFLVAIGEPNLQEFLNSLKPNQNISEAVHHKLLKSFKQYTLVGGMPAAVSIFLEDPVQGDYQKTHLSVLQTYRDDFGKYASRAKQGHLQDVFDKTPSLVGKVYKYSHVNKDVPTREIKGAFELLVQAGVITRVFKTSGHALPLMKEVDGKKFKTLFLDAGLMQTSCGLTKDIALSSDLLLVYAGAIAEQVIGQNLLTLGLPYKRPEAFFWNRDKKSSQAEIDYLLAVESKIIPVEVKSGKTGSLKSMRLFLQENPKSPFGVRFSGLPFSFYDHVLSIPLYAVGQVKRLVEQLI